MECENKLCSCQSAGRFSLYGFNKSFLLVASDANQVQECGLSVSRISEFDTDGFFFFFFFVRSHLQLCVYFTIWNQISAKINQEEDKQSGALVRPITVWLMMFSELEETERTTSVEILSKIEERAFRRRAGECVENVRTHYRLLTDSPKRENRTQSGIWLCGPALGGGRLSAFRSLLGHDKWCWMRRVKRSEIRKTELPDWSRAVSLQNKLVTQRNWVQGICGGSSQHAARGNVHLWTLGEIGCGGRRRACSLAEDRARLHSTKHLQREWHVHAFGCTALWPFDWTDVTTVRVKQPAETTIVLSYKT